MVSDFAETWSTCLYDPFELWDQVSAKSETKILLVEITQVSNDNVTDTQAEVSTPIVQLSPKQPGPSAAVKHPAPVEKPKSNERKVAKTDCMGKVLDFLGEKEENSPSSTDLLLIKMIEKENEREEARARRTEQHDQCVMQVLQDIQASNNFLVTMMARFMPTVPAPPENP